jgi:hypothetical protein
VSEHVFRCGDLKLGEDGEIHRFVNEAGEPKWICISTWKSPFEEMLMKLLNEVIRSGK